MSIEQTQLRAKRNWDAIVINIYSHGIYYVVLPFLGPVHYSLIFSANLVVCISPLNLDWLPTMKISIAEASLLALFFETLSCGARSFIEGILPPGSLSRRPEQPCSTLYLPALFILLTKTSIHVNSPSQYRPGCFDWDNSSSSTWLLSA